MKTEQAQQLLICLPYAGASSMTFSRWAERLAPEAAFVTLDYPGHGSRLAEAFATSLETLLAELEAQIVALVRAHGLPYYLTGHCLGAELAYELAIRLGQRPQAAPPTGLILSGQGLPGTGEAGRVRGCEDEAVLARLVRDGAIEPGMLDPDLREYVKLYVLSPMRADMGLREDYDWPARGPRDLGRVLVIGAEDDPYFTEEDFRAWDGLSEAPIEHLRYAGGHYALVQSPALYADLTKHWLMGGTP